MPGMHALTWLQTVGWCRILGLLRIRRTDSLRRAAWFAPAVSAPAEETAWTMCFPGWMTSTALVLCAHTPCRVRVRVHVDRILFHRNMHVHAHADAAGTHARTTAQRWRRRHGKTRLPWSGEKTRGECLHHPQQGQKRRDASWWLSAKTDWCRRRKSGGKETEKKRGVLFCAEVEKGGCKGRRKIDYLYDRSEEVATIMMLRETTGEVRVEERREG